MSDFSLALWRKYCGERVRPQHSHDPGQLARLERLLAAANIGNVWRSLANDVTKKWPEYLEPLTWQEALHNVMGTLIFPPSPPEKSELDQSGFLFDARRRFKASGVPTLPLIPATEGGKNAERNWLALYLKTRIIPTYFNRKHYDEIADLVNAALDLEDKLSADHVRLLQPYHLRTRQHPKT